MDYNELNKKSLQYLNNELSEKEKVELVQILSGSEEAREYFSEIKTLFDHSRQIQVPDFDKDSAYLKVEQKLVKKTQYLNPVIIKSAAATIMLMILLTVVLYSRHQVLKNDFVEIYVKKGEKVQINLPDGNTVNLNSETTLKYPVNYAQNKQISIIGEAYFEFQSKDYLPLKIKVNDIIIQGNNTSFNIKNRITEPKSEIVVTCGSLQLFNPEWKIDKIVLKEGEVAYLDNLMPLYTMKNEDANFLAWKTEKLNFDKTPLGNVVETLSEYYDIPIFIEGSIKYCRFTSAYEHAKLDEILEDIKKEFNPTIDDKHEIIMITGDDC